MYSYKELKIDACTIKALPWIPNTQFVAEIVTKLKVATFPHNYFDMLLDQGGS